LEEYWEEVGRILGRIGKNRAEIGRILGESWKNIG
jgi:hypothetical protein